MDEDFINSLSMTITMYQTAFNTFQKENPHLDTEEIIALTDSWWQGVMYMAGVAGSQKGGKNG